MRKYRDDFHDSEENTAALPRKDTSQEISESVPHREEMESAAKRNVQRTTILWQDILPDELKPIKSKQPLRVQDKADATPTRQEQNWSRDTRPRPNRVGRKIEVPLDWMDDSTPSHLFKLTKMSAPQRTQKLPSLAVVPTRHDEIRGIDQRHRHCSAPTLTPIKTTLRRHCPNPIFLGL